jgi:hypothetical protein
MIGKKINQLATELAPATTDLTIIGNPVTGVSKKITLSQIANLFATSGTVTSVAVTETGNALTITGSPITTAGTINIGFAGAATQYVRGDGQLSDFPTSTGGGSSVSYYLNSSVSQGTLGGVAYRQFSKTPIAGAGTDISVSANGYIASYITDANDPALLEVPAGNFNCELYFSVNSNNHNPYVYAEVYKYDGTTFTLLGSSQSVPEYLTSGTTLSPYYFAVPVTATVLTITDRIAIRIYANVDGRTVTLHTENSHLCQVVTTFSKGLTSLNNLTRQVQFLATGTSGTDFNIASSTATHTFNLPTASATNRGALSSADWTTFNNKQNALTNPVTGTGTANFVSKFTGSTTITSSQIWDNGTSILIGTTGSLPGIKVGIYSSTQRALEVVSTNASALFVQSPAAFIMSISNGTWITQFTNTGRLDLAGDLLVNSIANATTDTDRFLVSDSGVIKYRTGAELLSDIGGQPSGTYVTSVGLSSATSGVTIGSTPITTSGTITLAIATASGSAQGLLSSTDWTTFNNKQNALTNPVTGTGTTNYLPKFTGASAIGNSAVTDDGTTVSLISRALSGNAASFSGIVSATSGDIRSLGTATDGVTAGPFISVRDTSNAYQMLMQLNASYGLDIWSFTGSWNKRLTLSASGNLGLGVTPSAWVSTWRAIQLAGGSLYTNAGGTTGQIALGQNWYYDGTNNFYINSAAASDYYQFGGSHVWRTAPSGTAGNAISFTQAMTLNASGFLGIGETNPTSRLHIQSSASGGQNIRVVTSVAAGRNYMQFANGSGDMGYIGYGGADGKFYINNQLADDMLFVNNGATRLTIASTGAATFSSSVTATSGLTVGSLGSGSDAVITLATNASGSPRSIYYKASTATINFTQTGGADLMTLTNGGNLGIGITAPTRKLHVYGTASVFEGILVENSTSNAYALYQSKTGNSNLWQFGTWVDNSFRIGTSGVGDFLTIKGNGIINLSNVPSSSAGLSSGDIYKSAGVLMIV